MLVCRFIVCGYCMWVVVGELLISREIYCIYVSDFFWLVVIRYSYNFYLRKCISFNMVRGIDLWVCLRKC